MWVSSTERPLGLFRPFSTSAHEANNLHLQEKLRIQLENLQLSQTNIPTVQLLFSVTHSQFIHTVLLNNSLSYIKTLLLITVRYLSTSKFNNHVLFTQIRHLGRREDSVFSEKTVHNNEQYLFQFLQNKIVYAEL